MEMRVAKPALATSVALAKARPGPGVVRPGGAAMRAMIDALRRSARRFLDDGWLPLVLFAAVMLAAFLER
ncbi:MAG: hypothetical protein WBW74_24230 [Xanthobacteraceae bacterium]